MFLQLKVKKSFVYGPIAFVWIVIPTLEITYTAVTTDIVKGRCRPFSVYSSYAMEKSIGFFSLFINYILPLSLLIFCYARIVRGLRTKVSFVSMIVTRKHSESVTSASTTL